MLFIQNSKHFLILNTTGSYSREGIWYSKWKDRMTDEPEKSSILTDGYISSNYQIKMPSCCLLVGVIL